jgi:DNA polymerase V
MHMDVTDVWGIGRRLGKRLNDVGINTAWQLSKAKPGFIRKEFSILVENTVHELNGIPKLNWDEVRSPKQQIFSTRSFGQRVTDKSELRHALISHVTIAASKLRQQNSLVKTLQIFACSSPHDNDSYYRQSILHTFPTPTSDTSIIAHAVSTLVDSVYRKGVKFYKCGVGLVELVDAAHYQQDLFNVLHDKTDLMHCIDRINSRYGRNTVHVAAQGTIQSTMQGATQKCAMRREFLSPQYTTRLADIPKIFCN